MSLFEDLISRGVIASRPAAGGVGRLYISTDEADSPKWYRDNGTSWDDVTPPVSGGGGLGDYILIRDEKAAGTASGTFTAAADQTRTLNTKVADAGGHCTLASNQFTLAAGTYRIRASAPAWRVNNHVAWLYNVTDATDVIIGTSQYNEATANTATAASLIVGEFTIASSKTFEIRHRCGTTSNSNGFGVPHNLKTEVYTVVELWRE